MNKEKENKPRKGCKDVFNAFMLEGAKFVGKEDIPFCPTTAKEVPSRLVAYDITKNLKDKKGFVHFYLDDQKFDGKSGIWHESKKALERLKGFDGIITPDFSTNQDFPAPIKKYNTYRMRSFGYWAGKNGI